jgi:hypothetical protein
MRTLILLGLVVGGLVVAGAIHISQSNGTIQVSIDEQKVKNVAGAAVSLLFLVKRPSRRASCRCTRLAPAGSGRRR